MLAFTAQLAAPTRGEFASSARNAAELTAAQKLLIEQRLREARRRAAVLVAESSLAGWVRRRLQG
jgi:hypothetical protein